MKRKNKKHPKDYTDYNSSQRKKDQRPLLLPGSPKKSKKGIFSLTKMIRGR